MQDILRRIAAPVDMTRTWIDAMDAYSGERDHAFRRIVIMDSE
jgi:hypothetical protein